MKSNNKISVGIYEIDTFNFEELNFDDLTLLIIKRINEEETNKTFWFKIQPLKKQYNEHEIKIFFARKLKPVSWGSFFKDVVSEDSDLQHMKNMYSSFIAFIRFKEKTYAIAGGIGNTSIPRFSSQDFGMQILSRVIEKDHKVIKGLQDRGITGNVLGQTKFYRGDQKISDEDQFGKIYKQVKAELNKKILIEIFGFPENEIKRKTLGCLAKNSFQLNKRIDFEALLRVIEKLSILLDNEPNFILNKVTQITRRTHGGKNLITNLKNHLTNELYKSIRNNEELNFDFCNKDFEKYFNASKYSISNMGTVYQDSSDYRDLGTLVNELKTGKHLLLDSLEEFKCSFLDATIETLDEAGERLTYGTIFHHIHGEVYFENKSYFLIDEEWYLIQSSYIEDLNEDCKEALAEICDEQLITDFFDAKKSEKAFNSTFIGRENHLVFDTITVQNIELCDILKYDKDYVHLIHVKKGFKNSIRELTSQVLVSAKRVLNDKRNNDDFIDRYEKKVKKGKNSQSEFIKLLANQEFPDNGLRSLFHNKLYRNIIFCLAFVDTSPKYRSLKNDIKSFNSNIAKFSILELRKELNALSFGVRIIQLQKKAKTIFG